MENIITDMQTFKTFREIRALFKIEKWFHMPWHFSQSGQYVCFLEGGKECYKLPFTDGYAVRDKR